MQGLRWCTVILVAFFILPSLWAGDGAKARANLVRNSSMEAGSGNAVADWRFWGWAPEGVARTARGEWDRTVARTGSASLKIINGGERDVGTWTNRQGKGFIPVKPGAVYTVSAYLLVESLESPVSTHFRAGFCSIGAEGEVAYFPAQTRKQIDPRDERFTEAGVWKQLAVAARAPTGATHVAMDIDLVGKGVAWVDDAAVTEGYDASAFGGKTPEPRIAVSRGPDLDPASAEAPLAVTFQVSNPGVERQLVLRCEVIDYWFRPSVFERTLRLAAADMREVTIAFDAATCARLFAMRANVGASLFKVTASLASGGQQVADTVRMFRFQNRVKEYGTLPPLPPQKEVIDDIFGEQTLVDVIRCYDPDDPHPYIEGGRGLGAKATGAVPNEAWKDIYRETSPAFTGVETILGKRFRVTHGWGWFAYKFNRTGLEPNRPYLVVLEYPEDVGRTYTIFNTGISCSLVGGYGFHTGRTLGDHWTRTLNSEYVDYPLSGDVRLWHSLFHLGAATWAPGDPWQASSMRGRSTDGFWFVVGGVGPSQDALAAGAAVSTIKLYEVADLSALFPRIVEPPLELGRREMFVTAESDGTTKYLAGKQRLDLWAKARLYDARFLGLSGISPNGKTDLQPLLDMERREQLGLKVFPRWMIEREVLGRIGVPPEALAKNVEGEDAGLGVAVALEQLPDILHPATLRGVLRLITEELAPQLGHPACAGLMLYKHYGAPIPVSFSAAALRLYESEEGVSIPGADSAARRAWLLANRKNEYYQWWYGKKRSFILAIRDHLRSLRPDLKLFYFPWHSDDDYPFSCGRLRYAGKPLMDKIYVPGTNILLVPSFTVPPDEWTAEEKRNPKLARRYYREAIAPELKGQVSIEDVLYGRYRDMTRFWGARRSGGLPHLVYPREMDLVAMLTEPGGIYANGVGYNPRLFRDDDAFVYWAPVRHRFTADNPALLELFRTGEGSAVAVHMPYNEETSHLNVPSIHGAHGVEHGGPSCMLEEVLAMVHSDPTHIMDSMWEPLKRGFPRYARAFAQAYRALPATPSAVLRGATTPPDEEIVVRSYETEYGQYLAVINRAFDLKPRQSTLAFKPAVRAVDRVLNLGTGAAVPFRQTEDGRIELELVLLPMSLTSLHVIDRRPGALARDVRITPPVFSPNGDGHHDAVTVTGRTVTQITDGRWAAAIHNAAGRLVRRFEGDVPELEFTWDGTANDGSRCPDGTYGIRCTAAACPGLEYRRQVSVDTTAPRARPVIAAPQLSVTVNNSVVTGTVAGLAAGEAVYLRQKGFPDRLLSVLPDDSFAAEVEALDLGDNVFSFIVRDRAGNAAPAPQLHVRFSLATDKPIGFDFGAGPIMAGFSAMRNDTSYSAERGYGWIKYGNVWKGDRGIGDHLIRDYCSGKEDREWAVHLPNGTYSVTIVMVDTRFDQFAPDIRLEGRLVAEHRSISKNVPLRLTVETEVSDGVLNCEFINPGHLPYFALNGIIIERK